LDRWLCVPQSRSEGGGEEKKIPAQVADWKENNNKLETINSKQLKK